MRTFSPPWVREHSYRLSKEQFSAHVAGRRCGVAGCQLHDKLIRIRDQKRRRFLALRRYVQTDRLWQQDRTAQAALKKLPASERRQIEALERAIRRKIKQRVGRSRMAVGLISHRREHRLRAIRKPSR